MTEEKEAPSNSQTWGGFVCGLWFPGSTAGGATAAANIITLIFPWPVPGLGFWGSPCTLPIVNLSFFTGNLHFTYPENCYGDFRKSMTLHRYFGASLFT